MCRTCIMSSGIDYTINSAFIIFSLSVLCIANRSVNYYFLTSRKNFIPSRTQQKVLWFTYKAHLIWESEMKRKHCNLIIILLANKTFNRVPITSNFRNIFSLFQSSHLKRSHQKIFLISKSTYKTFLGVPPFLTMMTISQLTKQNCWTRERSKEFKRLSICC